MTTKHSTLAQRTAVSMAVAVAFVAAMPTAASAASPTPFFPSGWTYDQDQELTYRWSGSHPIPTWLGTAIRSATDGSRSSRASRAPVFRHATDGKSVITYDAPPKKGYCTPLWGIACAGRSRPDTFRMNFRGHGTEMAWGILRWCQLDATYGCIDVERAAIHEFGHVHGLAHADGQDTPRADPADTVMSYIAPSKPRDGWDTYRYQRCDVARLQLAYDTPGAWEPISTCLSLATVTKVKPQAVDVAFGALLGFKASLRIEFDATYGQLSGNMLNGRRIMVQRLNPSSGGWDDVVLMTMTSDVGFYEASTRVYESAYWRGVLLPNPDDGLRPSVSAVTFVEVAPCTSGCTVRRG